MAQSVDDVVQRLRGLELSKEVQYALSVQAGASLVAPYSNFKEVHVYAKEEKDVGLLEKRMNLKPGIAGGQSGHHEALLPQFGLLQ